MSARRSVLKYSFAVLPFTVTLFLWALTISTLATAVFRRPTAVINRLDGILFGDDEILHPRSAKLVTRNHPVYGLLHDRRNALLRNHIRHRHLAKTSRIAGVAGVDLPFRPAFGEIETARVLDNDLHRERLVFSEVHRALAEERVRRLARYAPKRAVRRIYNVRRYRWFCVERHIRRMIYTRA